MDWSTRKTVWRAWLKNFRRRFIPKIRWKDIALKYAVRLINKIEPSFFKAIRTVAYERGKREAEEKHETARRDAQRNRQKELDTKRKSFQGNKQLRRTVLKESGLTCHYCGKFGGELTVDHLVPLSRGGKNERSNLVAACRDCNEAKGNLKHTEILRK